ncbi:MAG: exodeoxyribonuclease VII small subunit [Bradymonadia bacterium]|jgi:exodeoxyribonuclease VII small subunit
MSKSAKPKPEESADFETVLARLETVVEQLEGDDLALEEALKAYADGVALAGTGASLLSGAERRIEELKIQLSEAGA